MLSFFTSFIRCESSSGKDSKPVLFNFNHRKFGISATRFGKSSFWKEKTSALLRIKILNEGKEISPNYLEVIPGQIKTTNERKHTFRHLEIPLLVLPRDKQWTLYRGLRTTHFSLHSGICYARTFCHSTAEELCSLLLKHSFHWIIFSFFCIIQKRKTDRKKY